MWKKGKKREKILAPITQKMKELREREYDERIARERKMSEEIQGILDSLNNDGSVMVSAGWYFMDLNIPLGIEVFGY